jgi:hypothetical protein
MKIPKNSWRYGGEENELNKPRKYRMEVIRDPNPIIVIKMISGFL